MSIKVMSWVFDNASLTNNPTEMLILLTLADHASDDGGLAYPGIKKMAERCRVSERTVQRTLADLVERRIIQIQKEATPTRPTVYRFPSFVKGGVNLTPGDTAVSPGGVTNIPPGGDTAVSPEPSLEPSSRTISQLPNSSPSRAREVHARTRESGESEEEGRGRREERIEPIASDSRSASQHHSTPSPEHIGSSVSNTESNGVQSTEQWTPQYEMKHPYWTELRQEAFRTFGKQYPKPGNKWEAAREWRVVFEGKELLHYGADGIKYATPLYQSLYDGLKAWHDYWQDQDTPDQYIPLFANWIAKRKWMEHPGVRR